MTNYCTIEEAWSVPSFGTNSRQQKQQQEEQQQHAIENTLANNNNSNFYNNNFDLTENFQNFVIENSPSMESEEEEDSSEEYYNNTYMAFNSNNNNSNNRNNNNRNNNNRNNNNSNNNNRNNNNSNNNNRNNNQVEKNNALEAQNEELKSVVEDLNKKMNFILDKMNSEERQPVVQSKELENNLHDLVLFVLFGILVVMILDGFAKLVLKFAKKDLN